MAEEASGARSGDAGHSTGQDGTKQAAAPEGSVEFLILVRGGLWRLSRDGSEIGAYSHADRAAHDAVVLARELQETGQPAVVRLQAEGRTLVLDTGPQGRSEPREAETTRSSVDGR